PVVRPAMMETTALGAAFLAGLGVGFWKEIESFSDSQGQRRFEPGMPRSQVNELRARWNEAVARAKGRNTRA
ncbi:MAG: glycerol kinase, partial [Candidatus Sulfotelmatobacter sp.]